MFNVLSLPLKSADYELIRREYPNEDSHYLSYLFRKDFEDAKKIRLSSKTA